jgi:hypothetical protein
VDLPREQIPGSAPGSELREGGDGSPREFRQSSPGCMRSTTSSSAGRTSPQRFLAAIPVLCEKVLAPTRCVGWWESPLGSGRRPWFAAVGWSRIHPAPASAGPPSRGQDVLHGTTDGGDGGESRVSRPGSGGQTSISFGTECRNSRICRSTTPAWLSSRALILGSQRLGNGSRRRSIGNGPSGRGGQRQNVVLAEKCFDPPS